MPIRPPTKLEDASENLLRGHLRLGRRRIRWFVPAIPWPWLRIVVAVVLAATVNWAYRESRPYIGDHSTFIVLALIAVIASAWVGRFLSGLLTLMLCVGQWIYYLSEPAKSFTLGSIEDVRLVLAFLAAGVLICLIIEALYSGRRRLEGVALEGRNLADQLFLERQRLGAVLSNLPGIVWEAAVDPAGGMPQPTFFSANVKRLLGYSAEELTGTARLWDELFLADERELMIEALRSVARDGSPRVVKHRWRRSASLADTSTAGGRGTAADPGAGGAERWIETHCGGGAQTSAARVRCVSLDITDAENVERVLAGSERRFRAAADRAPILIWIARPAAGVVWANRAWLEFRGRALAQEVGQGWIDGVHPEDAERVSREARSAFDRREEFRLEFRTRRFDGAWRWILAVGVPRLDVGGEFQDFLGFSVDLSDRKQLELELEALVAGTERARQVAEEATRSKDEFLARISHELRNPLNGILGWTQVLNRPGVSQEDVERGVELIDSGARALGQLVDDLLDLSSIAAGKMRLSLAPTDFRRIVESASQGILPSAVAKGVTLECAFDPELPPVSGDARRLQQIVWNLLSNAVKFTPAGGRIDVRLEGRDGAVVLAVRDNGIGIAPEFLPEVFSPFTQQEAATTRRYRGLGLGLSIVRSLVELHGGSVSAHSAGTGQGATFEVAIPQALAGAAAAERPRSVRSDVQTTRPLPLAGLRVLVVDDDLSAREILPRLLGGAGAVVHTADSAEGGLSALLAFGPDVLVSDIEMPGTDGYTFLRRVRAFSDAEGGGIPAVALTAYTGEEERRRTRLAGYQAHLGKPVSEKELLQTVARLAGRPAGEPIEARK